MSTSGEAQARSARDDVIGTGEALSVKVALSLDTKGDEARPSPKVGNVFAGVGAVCTS
jgi:hypothetical protein